MGDGDATVVPFPVIGGAVVVASAELTLSGASVGAALDEEAWSEPDGATADDDWEARTVDDEGAATVDDEEATASPEGDGVALSPQADAAPPTPLP